MQREGSSSRSAAGEEEDALEAARARLHEAKSKRASLRAEIERLRAVPTNEEVEASRMAGVHPMPPHLVELSKLVNAAEEKCILHRATGWTVFEIDLDIGRRQRQQRRAEGRRKAGKAALGLGVRLDTFWRGRFYEPYYLVFAKKSQMLTTGEQVTGAALDAAMPEAHVRNESSDDDEERNAKRKAYEPGSEPVRLLRHTIPHFVPLQSLVTQYLGSGDMAPKRKRGGFHLLDGLMSRDGLWLFLGHLHTYLQAFVSRREQVIALQSLRIPGSRSRAHMEAFGNDSFNQVSVQCRLGLPSQSDVQAYEEEEGIDRTEYERVPGARKRLERAHKLDRAAMHRAEKNFGQMAVTIKLYLQFTDLTSDHIGPALEDPNANGKAETICQYGSVIVDCTRPLLDSGELRRARRHDFEDMILGKDVDLDKAVLRILKAHHRRQAAGMSDMDLSMLKQHAAAHQSGSEQKGEQSSVKMPVRRLVDSMALQPVTRPKLRDLKKSRNPSHSDEA